MAVSVKKGESGINIDARRGTTLRVSVALSSSGNAVDLTNYDIKLIIYNDSRLDHTIPQNQIKVLTEGSGIQITSAPEGDFDIVLTASETESLEFDSAPYRLQAETNTGDTEHLFDGYITLR